MTAVFPCTFDLPAPPPPLSASDSAAALWLAPSAYLRLRRQTAGLTIPQVAEKLCDNDADRREMIGLIACLETTVVTAKHPSTLLALARAFSLDPAVYWALVDRQGVPPRVCRTCGCSYWDSCLCGHGDAADICELVSDILCSRCAGAQAGEAAA